MNPSGNLCVTRSGDPTDDSAVPSRVIRVHCRQPRRWRCIATNAGALLGVGSAQSLLAMTVAMASPSLRLRLTTGAVAALSWQAALQG